MNHPNKLAAAAKSLIWTLFLILTVSHPAVAQEGCSADVSWEFDPPLPADGTYGPNQEITICASISNFSGQANWAIGFELLLPDAFVDSTLSVISSPQACGTSNGNWLFLEELGCSPNLEHGPGFYYDANSGGPFDGNPCNNFGDFCTGTDGWTFCFSIKTALNCTDLDDLTLTPGVRIIDDSAIGFLNWSSPNFCTVEAYADELVTLACCDVSAGTSPEINYACAGLSYCLFDFLANDPSEGGIWSNPSGQISTPCIIPDESSLGAYTYTVMDTAGCTASTSVNIQNADLGTVQTNTVCVGTYQLSLPLGTPIAEGGAWYYPDSESGVPGGTIDTDEDPAGIYRYLAPAENGCSMTASVEIIFSFGPQSGEETFITYTAGSGHLCLFDTLAGNPSPGGQWALQTAAGVNVGFYPASTACFSESQIESIPNYQDGFQAIYILGSFPCDPTYTTLHIEYALPEPPGISVDISNTPGAAFNAIEIMLYAPGSADLISGYAGSVGALGMVSVQEFEAGTYDIYVHVTGFLQQSFESVTLTAGNNPIMLTDLVFGDINGDNTINIGDFTLMASSFGISMGEAGYVEPSDYDGNGSTNINDFTALAPSFGLSGAPSPIE